VGPTAKSSSWWAALEASTTTEATSKATAATETSTASKTSSEAGTTATTSTETAATAKATRGACEAVFADLKVATLPIVTVELIDGIPRVVCSLKGYYA
jgi:hypothetical protein